MASPTTLLFLTIITTIFATSATARPCKTIFFITSFQNPNNPNNPTPRFTLLITQTHTHTRPIFINPTLNPSSSKPNDVVSSISKQSKPYTSSSSFGDRTMDIMSVVGALLFGAGCGALTAATMYLIWSFCSNNRGLDFASDYSDDDDVEDVEDDVSNKKTNGYVAVSTTDVVVVKDVPPTADEVDAMKR